MFASAPANLLAAVAAILSVAATSSLYDFGAVTDSDASTASRQPAQSFFERSNLLTQVFS